jgi:c-di-GMP-binding flagellar brake protein YcgR
MTVATAWPQVNERVTVRLLGRPDAHPSRVEDIDGDELLIAAVVDGRGVPVIPERGEEVEIAWNTPRGVLCRRGTVVERAAGALRLWRVQGHGDPGVQQRREFVRVPVALEMVMERSGRRLAGTVIDLSESGLRVILKDAGTAVQAGDLARITVAVEGEEVSVVAKVVRSSRMSSGLASAELGMCFVEIPPAQVQVLRRHIFAQQVRQRAMGL